MPTLPRNWQRHDHRRDAIRHREHRNVTGCEDRQLRMNLLCRVFFVLRRDHPDRWRPRSTMTASIATPGSAPSPIERWSSRPLRCIHRSWLNDGQFGRKSSSMPLRESSVARSIRLRLCSARSSGISRGRISRSLALFRYESGDIHQARDLGITSRFTDDHPRPRISRRGSPDSSSAAARASLQQHHQQAMKADLERR